MLTSVDVAQAEVLSLTPLDEGRGTDMISFIMSHADDVMELCEK